MNGSHMILGRTQLDAMRPNSAQLHSTQLDSTQLNSTRRTPVRRYPLTHVELGNEEPNGRYVAQAAAMEERARSLGVGGRYMLPRP